MKSLSNLLDIILFILFIPIYIIGIALFWLNKRDPDILFWVFNWPLIFIAKSFSSKP